MFFRFPASQAIPVIPVSQVISVIPVNPVNPVSPVSPVGPVSPVSLAHLWVLFGVILRLFNSTLFHCMVILVRLQELHVCMLDYKLDVHCAWVWALMNLDT